MRTFYERTSFGLMYEFYVSRVDVEGNILVVSVPAECFLTFLSRSVDINQNHHFNKVISMQRSGTVATRIKIQPSNQNGK